MPTRQERIAEATAKLMGKDVRHDLVRVEEGVYLFVHCDGLPTKITSQTVAAYYARQWIEFEDREDVESELSMRQEDDNYRERSNVHRALREEAERQDTARRERVRAERNRIRALTPAPEPATSVRRNYSGFEYLLDQDMYRNLHTGEIVTAAEMQSARGVVSGRTRMNFRPWEAMATMEEDRTPRMQRVSAEQLRDMVGLPAQEPYLGIDIVEPVPEGRSVVFPSHPADIDTTWLNEAYSRIATREVQARAREALRLPVMGEYTAPATLEDLVQ